MFFGLGFSLTVINFVVAGIVTILGISFEGWQLYEISKNSKKVDKIKERITNTIKERKMLILILNLSLLCANLISYSSLKRSP